MVGRFSCLLFTLHILLASTLSTSTLAQQWVQQPDAVFREWDLATFAMDPTAAVFYFHDEADSAIRAFSLDAGQPLSYSWSFSDRLHSMAVDYRSRVCILLQNNSSYYIQQLDEQLAPLRILKLNARSDSARPMRLLADYINQLWVGFFGNSSIDVYAIDGSTGIQRSHFSLAVQHASYYVWTLDESLNLWVQQSDAAQITYSFTSSGTAGAQLQLNHTTAFIHSMAVAADGALTFAYSNDQKLVTFTADQRRLPRPSWTDVYADDVLTDLTHDADGNLLARAVSGESVLVIGPTGNLVRVWGSSIVSFARVHSFQYDDLSGDLFVFGSTEQLGYSALYRLAARDGTLVQQYTELPARLSSCMVQQVELSNRGNLWHLLLCQAPGSGRRWQELYVTDRASRMQYELRLDDKPYFTIYFQRFLVDEQQQLIYIPSYNNTSKASMLNIYSFNLTLVGSLPTPFSLTSALVAEMTLNTHNSTVYFLTTTANWINCTLYALSLTAPPTAEPLFTVQVAAHINQRAQYHVTYTREDSRQQRPARVLISVHAFNGEGGVYEYDEAQQLVSQYGWYQAAIDHILVGDDNRVYGYSAARRRIVVWRRGGRGEGYDVDDAQSDTAERNAQVAVSVALVA